MAAKRRFSLWKALGTIITLLVLMAVWQGYIVFGYVGQIRQASTDLEATLQTAPSGWDLDRIQGDLDQTVEATQGIRRRTSILEPLADRLRWAPWIGKPLAAAPHAIDYAFQLASSGQTLFQAGRPLLAEFESGSLGASSLGPTLIDWTEKETQSLETARDQLEAAQQAREQFDPRDLPAQVSEPIQRVDPVLPVAIAGLKAAESLPAILGSKQPTTYLILAQNEDELRATGGFISGVGTVTLAHGQIQDLQIGDSYAVDDFSKNYPYPPLPLQQLMLAQQWLVRDSNWSPDFPTSAATAIQLYELSTGDHVDGVVAFDQTMIAQLLTVLGPVQLQGFDEPITTTNVRDYMHEAHDPVPGQRYTQTWWLHRKDFMRALGLAMIQNAMSLKGSNWTTDLVRQLVFLVHQKHLLVAFEDPSAQELLGALGIDGRVEPGKGDYLQIVDSNVGFNKVDARIDRSFAYHVDLSTPTKPKAELDLTYTHTVQIQVPCQQGARYGEGGYAELETRCYWDYIRVLAPSGASLVGGTLPDVPPGDLMSGDSGPHAWQPGEGPNGSAQFAGLLLLPTDQTDTLKLRFLLPPLILTPGANGDLTYTFRWGKQPGTGAVPISVEVTPPADFAAKAPAGWSKQGNDLVWQGHLQTDQKLQLTFTAQSAGP